MAMLHLMTRAAPHAGWTIHAVTVDHRLRSASADEAAFVSSVCADLGVSHDILVWDHGEIAGNLMQAASEARYALMAGWAQARGIRNITLAHTADDQAETFLMGLSRAAGLDGLSGMRGVFETEGIAFIRPFLDFGRTDLRAYLERHDQRWVDDPTNENDRYTRVKARRALKALKPLGISVERLAAVVRNLSSAQGALRQAVGLVANKGISEAAGSLKFDAECFAGCGPEIGRRLLIAMILWIGGQRHAPRESQMSKLFLAIHDRKDATLAGVRFGWKDDVCIATREARACGAPVPAGQIWDGRWKVSGGQGEVRALGANGLRQCLDWRATGLPRRVLEVTPGLWQGDNLLAAPCAGFGAANARCEPSFNRFLLSH